VKRFSPFWPTSSGRAATGSPPLAPTAPSSTLMIKALRHAKKESV
jgi:hypothetical protein